MGDRDRDPVWGLGAAGASSRWPLKEVPVGRYPLEERLSS
jgi:hypothetical protein